MRANLRLRRSNCGLHTGNQEAIAKEAGLQLRNSDCERREASSGGVQLLFRNSRFEIRNMNDIVWKKVNALIASVEATVGIIRNGA